MLKPLELPWRVRLWHFVRGLLFYNTVYWKRASDDLDPPTLTREERLSHQPARNLEIIRPREHPRAKIAAARGGQISLPTVAMPPFPGFPGEPASFPDDVPPPPASEPRLAETPDPGVDGPEVIIRRRRYRRRHNKVRPATLGKDPLVDAKASYFGWLFTGKKRR